jgi:hypothetical protein
VKKIGSFVAITAVVTLTILLILRATGFLYPEQGPLQVEPAFKGPVYEGKSLSEWLEVGYGECFERYPGAQKDADSAIRQMGTNAIPVLLEMLLSRDNNAQKRASMGFMFLGDQGKSALPALRRLAESHNPIVAASALSSVATMGAQGRECLVQALTNHIKLVRGSAFRIILFKGPGQFPPSERKQIIPLLQNVMNDPECFLGNTTNLLKEVIPQDAAGELGL